MHSTVLNQYIGKTIIIFGLGAEGRSTLEFVRQALPNNKIILTDDKPVNKLDPFWTQCLDTMSGVEYQTSDMQLDIRDVETAVLFKTPGIPAKHPLVQSILKAGGILTSNTQLFFDLVKNFTKNRTTDQSNLVTIGVTGTKGKSTTTSLIHHVLHTSGLTSYLGGNIGTPALTMWSEAYAQSNEFSQNKTVYFTLELSAHQLAELTTSPTIAVIQDIVPEHLDYYENFHEYLSAKAHLTQNQTANDIVIYNADSKTATQLADVSPAQKFTFSLLRNADCYCPHDLDNIIAYREEPILAAQDVPLMGNHNLYNVMPAIVIGKTLGIATTTIASAIKSFQSLPHRIQLVGTVNGVEYYDDSIATTPEAAIAAIRSFHRKQIVLIAGGYDRNQDYSKLAREILDTNVTTVILLPPTGEQLKQAILDTQSHIADEGYQLKNTVEVETMDQAVSAAHHYAVPGDIVLLSPAAASFGTFKDYQDRGDQFRENVLRLT